MTGVLIGLVFALALTRVMASLLYGVSSSDWLIFLCVSLLLILIALIASYLPARKAIDVDSVIALRNE